MSTIEDSVFNGRSEKRRPRLGRYGAGTPIPISGAPAAGFYGAGTTTVAPIDVD